MTKTRQYGFIQHGKLHLSNRKRFSDDCRQFKDCDVEIIIKKKGKRSSQANRYYWGCVVEEIRLNMLDRGYRYEAETIHEFLKGKFNFEVVVIEATGERIDIPSTTTDMNKDEFYEYVERVREWAAISLELNIPDPETQLEMFETNK